MDFSGLGQACSDAITALESGDFLTARRKALEAQLVIVGIGSSATAGGANLQLALDTIDSVLDNIAKLEAYQAAKTGRGRFVRTGLRNGGGRFGTTGGMGQ